MQFKLNVDPQGVTHPYIERVYNEPGLSWREVKKALRQYYLDEAANVRKLRPSDAVEHIAEEA